MITLDKIVVRPSEDIQFMWIDIHWNGTKRHQPSVSYHVHFIAVATAIQTILDCVDRDTKALKETSQ